MGFLSRSCRPVRPNSKVAVGGTEAGCYTMGMSKTHEVRLKLRGELEAPPALRRFGSGWISGVLGFILGLGGLFLVVSLRAPGEFSMPEIRALHEHPWFRLVIHCLLLAAFGLSALSLALRPGKILGTCGVATTL